MPFLRHDFQSHEQGRKCAPPPPEKWSSRSQNKCSRSQNCAFVYMRCFAKQTKYFRNLEMYQTESSSSEIIWRSITYLFREFMNEISVKTSAKGWSFHLLSKHGDICYMSRLRVCTFIWNLGSARSFMHGWYSILAKISNPPNQTSFTLVTIFLRSLNYIFNMQSAKTNF